MNDYLAKPIEEEKLYICCCAINLANVAARLMAPEPALNLSFNPNATLDWQLAPAVAGKPDLARDMLQMLIDFLPEVRNKIKEQWWEKIPTASSIWSISYTGAYYGGVLRMKNLASLLSNKAGSGVHEEELELPSFGSCYEMDNVAREAKKIWLG